MYTQSASVDVPFRIRLGWGVGSLGTITYLNVVSALIVLYLTTVVKIDPALAGVLVTAVRLIDAFSDPLMGWITDRTQTRWGRRRPYLLLGALVCGASLPLVYSVHAWAPAELAPFAVFAVLVVYSLGFTVFNVPYLTMPVEMTTDRIARLSVISYRSMFMMLGSVLGSAAAPALLDKVLGRDGNGYAKLGLLAGGFVFVAMLLAFFGTKGARASNEPTPHLPVRQQIAAVLDNKPFMLLVGMKVLQFIALALNTGALAFFVTMVLKKDLTIISFFAISTVAMLIVSIPFWRWAGRFITKRTGLMIGIAGMTVGTLLWLLITPENSRLILALRGAFEGFFAAAILLFGQAIWLDAIDYDQQRTGLRREGMYTSIYVFVERLGYSIGPLLLGVLLQIFDFNKNLPVEQQPASAETAIIASMVWLPALAWGLSIIFLWFYRLPERLDAEPRAAGSALAAT